MMKLIMTFNAGIQVNDWNVCLTLPKNKVKNFSSELDEIPNKVYEEAKYKSKVYLFLKDKMKEIYG